MLTVATSLPGELSQARCYPQVASNPREPGAADRFRRKGCAFASPYPEVVSRARLHHRQHSTPPPYESGLILSQLDPVEKVRSVERLRRNVTARVGQILLTRVDHILLTVSKSASWWKA